MGPVRSALALCAIALAAAAAAVDQGASVVMLEAADAPGGTTRRSGGAFWIPNNSLMRAQGLTDPRDDALKLMARLAYPSLYDPAAPRLGLPRLHHRAAAAWSHVLRHPTRVGHDRRRAGSERLGGILAGMEEGLSGPFLRTDRVGVQAIRRVRRECRVEYRF